MSTIKMILHPTDFSPPAEYAFKLACALARDLGARITLLHVNPTSETSPDKLTMTEYKEMLWDDLRKLMNRDPKLREMYVKTELVEGDPVEEILRVVKERDCDMVVMGTHGRTGLKRLLLGSVAEAVLRKAACPVLVVKAPEPVPVEELPEVEAVVTA